MRGAVKAGALALTVVAAPLAAQQSTVRIPADEARQCAIWASYLSSESQDDPEAVEALLFATNYFIGHYEGATGRSIADGQDLAAAMAIVNDLDAVTQMCSEHMLAYGQRMIDWGEVLTRMGDADTGGKQR